MEMVVNGVSTRKVTNITEELCGASFSKSTVSSLSRAPDDYRAIEKYECRGRPNPLTPQVLYRN
jgi:putative transposase